MEIGLTTFYGDLGLRGLRRWGGVLTLLLPASAQLTKRNKCPPAFIASSGLGQPLYNDLLPHGWLMARMGSLIINWF
jgi:hypothetical protein